MKLHSLLTRKSALGAVAVVGLAAAATGVGVSPASAASVAATLSASSGPSGGTNTLTAVTSTAKFFTGAVVEFQAKAGSVTACTAAYATASSTVVVATPKILSSTKVAFTVPSTVITATASNWFVCIYPGTNTSTSLLTANAAYAVAAKPTVTAISPSGGPALGGGTVTLTGTNFITGLTAKIGSTPLTSVTVVSTTSATAVVPAQAAGSALAVSVTTTGGTASKSAAYTYSNGIIVTPNTTVTDNDAGSLVPVDLDIMGVGFSSLDFDGAVSGGSFKTDGTAPGDAGAHVYLVDGDYDATDTDVANDHATPAKTVAETAECLSVLVVSDTELICTLNTTKAFGATGSVVANGTYTIAVVNDGRIDVSAGTGGADAATTVATTAVTKSIVSSGSTFTVAPY